MRSDLNKQIYGIMTREGISELNKFKAIKTLVENWSYITDDEIAEAKAILLALSDLDESIKEDDLYQEAFANDKGKIQNSFKK